MKKFIQLWEAKTQEEVGVLRERSFMFMMMKILKIRRIKGSNNKRLAQEGPLKVIKNTEFLKAEGHQIMEEALGMPR